MDQAVFAQAEPNASVAVQRMPVIVAVVVAVFRHFVETQVRRRVVAAHSQLVVVVVMPLVVVV